MPHHRQAAPFFFSEDIPNSWRVSLLSSFGCRTMLVVARGSCFMRPAYTALAVMLAGCATTTKPSAVWTRTDGRPVAGDAVLTQQFQIQRTICLGDGDKARANATDAAFLGCMAQKGYMLVTADKTPISQEQFAKLDAEQ